MEGPFWFPAKTHGWGWGLPVTWQGRAVMAAYAAVLAAAIVLLQRRQKKVAFTTVVVAATAVLVAVCFVTGEPPGR